MISLAKFAKPGRPMEAKAAMPKAKASHGADDAAEALQQQQRIFSRRKPAMAKRAAIERPWANMSKAAPLADEVERGDAEEDVAVCITLE